MTTKQTTPDIYEKREQLARKIKTIVRDEATLDTIRLLVAVRPNEETEAAWRELNTKCTV